MKEKLKRLWKGLTLNEKMMYGLLLAFAIGIIVRWDFITVEVGESFTNLFTPSVRDSVVVDSIAVSVDSLSVVADSVAVELEPLR
ncbi:MAG: hypothetical protein R3Y61_00465 [Rikenellaceae bacterium]